MQTHIIQIGKSLGLRLPKAVLDSLQLKRASPLSIKAKGDSIILSPVRAPRSGWSDAFAADAGRSEDLWSGLPAPEAWDN